jgi:hypothetical protein
MSILLLGCRWNSVGHAPGSGYFGPTGFDLVSANGFPPFPCPARARNHREPSIASAKGLPFRPWNQRCRPFIWNKRPTTSCPIRAVNQLQTQDTRTAARRGCGCDGRTQLGSWPDRIRRRRAPGAQCGRRRWLRRRSDSTDNCRAPGWSDGTRASAAGYCRCGL